MTTSGILSSMRGFGRELIAETATHSAAEKHILEIQGMGYDDDTHVSFSDFLYDNRELKPKKGDAVRWFGEILVDYLFLEAARRVKDEGVRNDHCRCNGCCLWPFTPPAIHIKKMPYTEAAFTFRKFGYHDVEFLADTGEYDDIFDKILLWRTYYKEPFHAIRYGMHIRSISGYHWCRNEAKKLEAEAEKNLADFYAPRPNLIGWKNRRREWVNNTIQDRKTQKQKSVLECLTPLSSTEQLQNIAESQYAIDFYPKEWGRQAAHEKALNSLDPATQQKLAVKLRGKRYQGWHDILGQLKEVCPACFDRLPWFVSTGRRVWGFIDPKLKINCPLNSKDFLHP